MAVTSIQPEEKSVFLQFGARGLFLNLGTGEEDTWPGHIAQLTDSIFQLTRAVRIAQFDTQEAQEALAGIECLSALASQLAFHMSSSKDDDSEDPAVEAP